jgi:DNA-binding beta-propeller fold protein YncE
MMSRTRIVFFLVFGLALAGIAYAEPVKLVYSKAVYADEQGVALKHPEGVACGPGATVVVADTENARLILFKLAVGALTEGNPIRIPQIKYPVRVQIGSNGDILVLDGMLRRVLRLSAAGAFMAAVEPKGVPGANVVPKSFALDREDGIYFLDNFSKRVVVTDPSGNYLREIRFPEKFGFFSDVTVDARGTLLLLDSVEGSLYSAEKTGVVFSILAKGLKEYANFPTHLTVDGKGTIYIVDQNGGGVLMVGQDGAFLGRQLTTGWKEGLLNYPSQMCISGEQMAVITDRENNRVQIYKLVR